MEPARFHKLGPLWTKLLAHPGCWFVVATVVLVIDFAAGPEIQFPIAFVFPVALAAWHRGFLWGAIFAVAQPLVRFGFHYVWESSWPVHMSGINLLVRVAVLCGSAWLVAHTARQRRHIKKLERLLPVCAWCKRICDERNHWQHLDSYLSTRSDLTFSHGICPECRKAHFPEEQPG
jgi:hypothetical protein